MANNQKMIALGLIVTAGIGVCIHTFLSGKHPEKYSIEWIESLSDADWETERRNAQLIFGSPKSDEETKLQFMKILDLFDMVKRQRDQSDKKPGFPVHNEHGWYLPSD